MIAHPQMAAVLAVTAPPALLAELGPRVNAVSWRHGVIDRAETRAAEFWCGVADRVVRRLISGAAVAAAVPLACAVPLAGIKLGDLDDTGLPPDGAESPPSGSM